MSCTDFQFLVAVEIMPLTTRLYAFNCLFITASSCVLVPAGISLDEPRPVVLSLELHRQPNFKPCIVVSEFHDQTSVCTCGLVSPGLYGLHPLFLLIFHVFFNFQSRTPQLFCAFNFKLDIVQFCAYKSTENFQPNSSRLHRMLPIDLSPG